MLICYLCSLIYLHKSQIFKNKQKIGIRKYLLLFELMFTNVKLIVHVLT